MFNKSEWFPFSNTHTQSAPVSKQMTRGGNHEQHAAVFWRSSDGPFLQRRDRNIEHLGADIRECKRPVIPTLPRVGFCRQTTPVRCALRSLKMCLLERLFEHGKSWKIMENHGFNNYCIFWHFYGDFIFK